LAAQRSVSIATSVTHAGSPKQLFNAAIHSCVVHTIYALYTLTHARPWARVAGRPPQTTPSPPPQRARQMAALLVSVVGLRRRAPQAPRRCVCHAMPCHAMPCHAMPCHAMPCLQPDQPHCTVLDRLPSRAGRELHAGERAAWASKPYVIGCACLLSGVPACSHPVQAWVAASQSQQEVDGRAKRTTRDTVAWMESSQAAVCQTITPLTLALVEPPTH